MKTKAILSAAAAAIGLSFGACGSEPPLTKAMYDAARRDLVDDYRTARIGCEPMEAAVRDACEADVRGRHDIALAELEAAYSPSGKTLGDLRLARARTDHQVAIGKCDVNPGKARDACITEAKLRYPGS